MVRRFTRGAWAAAGAEKRVGREEVEMGADAEGERAEKMSGVLACSVTGGVLAICFARRRAEGGLLGKCAQVSRGWENPENLNGSGLQDEGGSGAHRVT